MSLGDTNAPSWDVEVEKLGAWDFEANRGLLFVGTDTLLLLLPLLPPPTDLLHISYFSPLYLC